MSKVFIEESTLTAIGDAIREKTSKTGLIPPLDMPQEIKDIQTGGLVEAITITSNGTYNAPDGVGYSPVTVNVPQDGSPPDSAFNITGDCRYKFAYSSWNWFLEMYGNKITTKDITTAYNMFSSNTSLKEIPFDINFKFISSTDALKSMFASMFNIKNFPKLIHEYDLNIHLNFSSMFQACRNMKEVPEGLVEILKQNYELEKSNTVWAPWSNMFDNCYSLREIPDEVMKYMENPTISSYYYGLAYSHPFAYCCSLDRLVNVPCDNCELTSNYFNNWFISLFRLKDFTFAKNEDGTPFIRKWKNQSLVFSASGVSIGTVNVHTQNILGYNSGITADKEVIDDATYQALKNDADWFTKNQDYSRYNHDSAVNTINSLPDTSAYGVNTIKFMGNAGSKTDGGAINTLTAEEIAVASAKGWTVSF